LLLLLILAATGCFWGDESETRQLTGNYYLNGVSAEDPWYIYFGDGVGLADALISARVAEAGFNDKCIVLRAVSSGAQFYVIPLGKISTVESREEVRNKIIGPLAKAEFQAKVRHLNNGAMVPFNPKLTAF
jgi:hypothetical protein